MATTCKFFVKQARHLQSKENKELRGSGGPDAKRNNLRNQKNVGRKC